jgi:hypothetical protein
MASLSAAFDVAVETDDVEKHITLSRLVVDRLTADDESLDAITAGRAIEAMRYLNSSHLKALALLSLLGSTTNTSDASEDDDGTAVLDPCVEALIDTPMDYSVASHFSSLGLVDYSTGSLSVSNHSSPPILNRVALRNPQFFHNSALVSEIHERWTGDPAEGTESLAEIHLFPTGNMIGSMVLESIHSSGP